MGLLNAVVNKRQIRVNKQQDESGAHIETHRQLPIRPGAEKSREK